MLSRHSPSPVWTASDMCTLTTFFASVDLLDLERSKLYSCGTLRSNRKGFPANLKPVVKEGFKDRDESKTFQDRNLTVLAWQDNKVVIIVVTNCDPTIEEQVPQKKRDGSTIPWNVSSRIINTWVELITMTNSEDTTMCAWNIENFSSTFLGFFLMLLLQTTSYFLSTSLNLAFMTWRHSMLSLLRASSEITVLTKVPVVLHRACHHLSDSHFPVRGAEKQHHCHYCRNYRNERHGMAVVVL